MTNCVNCGAVLHGNKCDYCGTEYSGNGITATFHKRDSSGVLDVGGKLFNVYIGSMEATDVGSEAYRDWDGTMHRIPGKLKHKFELIEL